MTLKLFKQVDQFAVVLEDPVTQWKKKKITEKGMLDHMIHSYQFGTQVLAAFCSNFDAVVLSIVALFQKNSTIHIKSTTHNKPTFTNYCNLYIFSWEYIHVDQKLECQILHMDLLWMAPLSLYV